MKYLREFDTVANYEVYINGTPDLPNVSLCVQENEVHFNPYVSEIKLITKYNVTSTSEPTALRTNYEQNIFKSMEIDGVQLNELVTEYTFETTGVHTVKYELYDETKLGNNAPVFYNDNLIETIIPNSVTSIGNSAFLNCTGLTSVIIGNSVTSIGLQAFKHCIGLTSIDIPNSVTSIGENSFYDCSGLTSCIIGDGVTSIYQGAFQNCSNLTSCIIGNSVTSIGNYAFFDCVNLTSINIPDSITNISQNAFYGSGLTSITVNAITPPTLGSSVFNTNNCPIYVPSASVETYKAAEGWSDYADRIQAIS